MPPQQITLVSSTNLIIYGMLFAQAFFLIVYGLLKLNKSAAALPLIGLAAAFCGYALTPYFAGNQGTTAFAALLKTSMFMESFLPIFFWLLAEALFDDEFHWQKKHWLALVIASLSVLRLIYSQTASEALLVNLMKMAHLSLLLYALVQVFLGLKADMLLIRIRLRLACMIFGGLGLFAAIILNYHELSLRQLENSASIPLNLMILFILLTSTLFLVIYDDVLFSWQKIPPTASPVQKPVLELDTQLEQKLQTAMQTQYYYKVEGANLSGLATQLSIPEYRIRKFINETLGFRNFNHYLNHYRILAAQNLLRQSSSQNEKIISIAMDVGFASLATFNRVFKEQTGVTPSEYKLGKATSHSSKPVIT